MKAAVLSNRPDFNLMKQTDIQSFYHLQMPRWLFFDKKYSSLSLEAKVTYTFLLNRFQLSKLNNWINADGEVFIIYTRESLSIEIQISYRRVIDCMKELTSANLIWERRCGRGDANQIYLAQVELTNESASVYNSTPFVATVDESVRPAESACQEMQVSHIKTDENGTSRSAESACQDMRKPHTINIDIDKDKKKDTDNSDIDSKSVSPARTHQSDQQTDMDILELDEILANCELYAFSTETEKVFESAIERLFFSESFRIGNCTLPQVKVRYHLRFLDYDKLKTAEMKIARNTDKEIRNTTAYTMAVIFNSIWESESDQMNDPYLNSLKHMPPPGKLDERRRL